jgi:hypothetical protein
MERNEMVKKYRGISGVVRRAANQGYLDGEIKPADIRPLLPEGKNSAPDKVIIKSLYYLASQGDIVQVGGRYFVKGSEPKVHRQIQIPETKTSKGDALVVGKIISMDTIDGKLVAKVEVSSLEYR